MELKELLFKKHYAELDGPIFKSTMDFVLALLDEENPEIEKYESRRKSLYVIINSVLNGKKKMKSELESTIRSTIVKRIEQVPNNRFDVDKLMTGFKNAYQEKKPKKASSDAFTDSLKIFCDRSQKAEHTLVVSANPIELRNSGIGYKFMDVISENIGLRQRNTSAIKYTYFFPKDEDNFNTLAAEFWSKLYSCNARYDNDEEIKQLLIDKNNNGDISVYSIPHSPGFFMFDVTCFDNNKISKAAYSPYILPNSDRILMLSLNQTVLKNWLKNLSPLISNLNPENYKEEPKIPELQNKKLSDYKYDFEDAYNELISVRPPLSLSKVEREISNMALI